MQNKIVSRSNYAIVVYNDPISLLRAIKEHSLNHQETIYEMSIITDTFRSLFANKQKEGESLQDYTRRFKASTEILESHLRGPVILEKYVRTMENYDGKDIDKTTKMTAKASEGQYTFLYLENSDQDKYRSITSNLTSQKSLGNDQYPRTIVETNNALSNHKFDIVKFKKPDQKHHNKSKPKEEKDEEEVTPLSFAQMEGNCYCCGKAGTQVSRMQKQRKDSQRGMGY
jgi:hypothetical protein